MIINTMANVKMIPQYDSEIGLPLFVGLLVCFEVKEEITNLLEETRENN
jgi:hypothetical protein